MTQLSPEVKKPELIDLEPDATDVAKCMAYNILEIFHKAWQLGHPTSATFLIGPSSSNNEMDSTNVHRMAYEQCCATWGIEAYPEEAQAVSLGESFKKEVSAISAIGHPYPFCGWVDQEITHFERTDSGFISQVVLATYPTLAAQV